MRTRGELQPALGAPDRATLETIAVEAIARRRLTKWGSASLARWVEGRLDNRVLRTAWNYFKTAYDAPKHRAPFVAFLTSLVGGRSDGALARHFEALLGPIEEPNAAPHYGGRWPPAADSIRHWLAAFFLDEPEWRARLAAWARECIEP